MTVDEYMEIADPIIRKVAWKYSSRNVPFDDMAQEIRLEIFKGIDGFDESKSQWKSFVWRVGKLRAIDACRRYGHISRKSGKQNKFTARTFTDASYEDSEGRIHSPEPLCEPDQVELAEWSDLEDVVKDRNVETQAAFMYLQGRAMAQIARHFGLSESRVSQLMSTGCGMDAIRNLVNHHPHAVGDLKVIQTPELLQKAKGVMESNVTIEQAIRIATSPEAVQEIDRRIEAIEAELKRLREFRRAIAPKKARKINMKCDAEMESKVLEIVSVEPQKPGDIAEQLGVRPISVGRMVSASSKLAKQGAMVVPV